MRFVPFAIVVLLALASTALAVLVSPWWALAAVPFLALAARGSWDVIQAEHAILRNYPLLGHGRFLLEKIRPEIQQYFIERDYDGRPFSRYKRTAIYARAKLDNEEVAFGTELDTTQPGYEWLTPSLDVKDAPDDDDPQPRVTVGGPQCTKPYEMALLNVSAMSFGSLSGRAITALNQGAARGGFAHDTGEGAISDYHLQGGDLVWEIASGYFGCRTHEGRFDPDEFADKASIDAVKATHVKLSQGAKPGRGGVMPARKVTQEIADVRGVPKGEKCVSPSNHPEFGNPIGLLEFMAKLRELSGGKPSGFKLCIGSKVEFLAICKAMVETEIYPDFITIDGGEGGTGAGPAEFSNHMGMPLTEGLIHVHNSLVGVRLRDKIRLGASGKVANGFDIARRLAMGADYTNAARAMMMSIGCIQSQQCHLDTCPVGVATQDSTRVRALHVERSAERCKNFQSETVRSLGELAASAGFEDPRRLTPDRLMRRVNETEITSYDKIYHWLDEGELLDDPPEDWAPYWRAASAEQFAPAS